MNLIIYLQKDWYLQNHGCMFYWCSQIHSWCMYFSLLMRTCWKYSSKIWFCDLLISSWTSLFNSKSTGLHKILPIQQNIVFFKQWHFHKNCCSQIHSCSMSYSSLMWMYWKSSIVILVLLSSNFSNFDFTYKFTSLPTVVFSHCVHSSNVKGSNSS